MLPLLPAYYSICSDNPFYIYETTMLLNFIYVLLTSFLCCSAIVSHFHLSRISNCSVIDMLERLTVTP